MHYSIYLYKCTLRGVLMIQMCAHIYYMMFIYKLISMYLHMHIHTFTYMMVFILYVCINMYNYFCPWN